MADQATETWRTDDADRAEMAERVERSGTSFYWSMRLLPRAKREAMFAIYAFCRAVDDIADEPAPLESKQAGLAEWRAEIERLYAGRPTHAVARALVDPVRRFALRREDFLAVIDGCEMDAHGPVVAPDWSTLRLYCARVAGAVGHLSVHVFGAPDRQGYKLAAALGEAVQLTNLLRDVAEDARDGRLYLPRELLQRHGVPPLPASALAHPALPLVCLDVAKVAETRFAEAAEALRVLPHRAMTPARIIEGIYHRLLARLTAEGFRRLEPKMRLSKGEKLRIALARLVW
ncbi:MAG TPA: presqualene diphosphate synthase HpnD [Hypericibacter adhaerens]|jgi:phytoene synthase|uniref:presqualene diphosphate synthase HpnD n=1 Tax=Hypericibacter adhaerens TaxID=2602016 RepID=UPI002C6B4660|nr:presqualene diphosphate synthase HpnD [Hypericibacter adhaerens]HWA43849.1 presqualene diphosphate synthase HpnD [Hypericibacter adhaerens]